MKKFLTLLDAPPPSSKPILHHVQQCPAVSRSVQKWPGTIPFILASRYGLGSARVPDRNGGGFGKGKVLGLLY